MYYKHKSKIFIGLLVLIVLQCASCRNQDHRNPKPDISGISADEVKIVRFDKALFETGGQDPITHLREVESRYPRIFKSYTENFWGLVQRDSSQPLNVYDSLNNLVVSNDWMHRLYDSVMLIFNDMSDIEKELQLAVRYYKYYFPDSTLPQFYSYIGPFAYWAVIDEYTLGIELDMYLGAHFAYYGNFENNMPQYIVQRCYKDYITLNVMETLVDGLIPNKGSDATLLDEMIFEGKLLYYTDLVLPDTQDSIKMGYTAAQLEWCYDNEDEIWKYLVGDDLLFSKKTDQLRKYLGEAPTTVGMPDDSPGRVAVWVGWQIVRAYMDEHKGTSIHVLFAQTDGLSILKESGYEPGN